MSCGSKVLIPIFVFGSVLTILFLSVILFSVIYMNISVEKHERSNKSNLLYQEISSDENEFTSGLVRMNHKLSEEEFIFYRTRSVDQPKGSFVIISNFESQSPYECFGSCFCSDGRRSTTVLTRSLFILFSAFSTSVAFKMANEAFKDRCNHQFSETCAEKDINTEVSDCSPKETERSEGSYTCDGNCVRRRFQNDDPRNAQRDFEEEESRCDEIKSSGKVEVKSGNEDPRILFESQHLSKFCEKVSIWKFEFVVPTTAPMCTGATLTKYYSFDYSNIQCYKN